MMILMMNDDNNHAIFMQGMQGFSSATPRSTLHPSSLPDTSIHSHLKDSSSSLLTLNGAKLSGLLPQRIWIVWNSHPPSASFSNVNVSLVSSRWISAYLRANSSTSLAADRREGPSFDPALVKTSVVLSSTVWKRQEQNLPSNLDFAASPRYTAHATVRVNEFERFGLKLWHPTKSLRHMISQQCTTKICKEDLFATLWYLTQMLGLHDATVGCNWTVSKLATNYNSCSFACSSVERKYVKGGQIYWSSRREIGL